MRYKPLLVILAILLIGVLFWYVKKPLHNKPVSDFKNTSYEIEGAPIALIDGKASSDIAVGSASKLVTQYFGNEASGDLNGDGMNDVAFILTQTGGGSGTFYYAVAALKTKDGYQGTNGILLGDRIAPQTTEIKDGEVIVNYADRKPTEPMTETPSVGISKYLHIENGKLAETTK